MITEQCYLIWFSYIQQLFYRAVQCTILIVVVVLPDLFRGLGGTEELRGDPIVGPHPKVWTRGSDAKQSSEGGELDPANDVRRHRKKNSSVLSCIDNRTKKGCNHGSEVGTDHNGRDGAGPVTLRKPKESGRRESCEKDFVSRYCSGYVLSLQWQGPVGWKYDWRVVPLRFWWAICQFITGSPAYRRPTGSLELHGSRRSRRDPKCTISPVQFY